MKNIAALFFLIIIFIIMSCGGNNEQDSKDKKRYNISDFIASFDDLSLPVTLYDSLFVKIATDGVQIDVDSLYHIVGDTIFKKEFNDEKLKIVPVGKFSSKSKEMYLLLKVIGIKKQLLYVIVLDGDKKFKTIMPLLSFEGKTGLAKMLIDTKCTFTHVDNMSAADGSVYTYNVVYAYDNNKGQFRIILTDDLPGNAAVPVIDPIDTLPKKGKYAGNYEKDKRDFISIRDASNSEIINFFIYTEEKAMQCNGELKGQAKMIGIDSALYIGNNDPCRIGFKFSNGKIRVTETSCGGKHGMDCSFGGIYTKRKEDIKLKKTTSSHSTKK